MPLDHSLDRILTTLRRGLGVIRLPIAEFATHDGHPFSSGRLLGLGAQHALVEHFERIDFFGIHVLRIEIELGCFEACFLLIEEHHLVCGFQPFLLQF